MSIQRVTGLDLSITGTGIAWTRSDGVSVTDLVKPSSKRDYRLVEIRRSVMVAVCGSELVLIEGYLNKSFTAGITGMVHGAVRSALIEAGIPYATMAPKSLKKYATGKGTASKTDMALAAFKRGGVEFANDNECDAWWLWVAATEWMFGFDHSPVSMPAVNRESLKSIEMET